MLIDGKPVSTEYIRALENVHTALVWRREAQQEPAPSYEQLLAQAAYDRAVRKAAKIREKENP